MIMCILELFGFLNKRCQNRSKLVEKLRSSLFKSGPVRFGLGNRFLSNFAKESTLVQVLLYIILLYIIYIYIYIIIYNIYLQKPPWFLQIQQNNFFLSENRLGAQTPAFKTPNIKMAQVAELVSSQNSSLRVLFCFAYLDQLFIRTNHINLVFLTVF